MRIKKIMMICSVVLTVSFVGCGGGGSQEAKELLQKLLNVVGIPYNIIATVCQDDNSNGFCESTELQAKLFIEQGDSAEVIWQKLTQLEEGKYFLETYDVTKPILLVLQDVDNVHYDEGKFTLNFNGFVSNEINETKELSILESMVDAGYLTPESVVNIKNLDTQYAQEQFYATLLKDLETNINTLRANGLDAQQAMSANIQDMAGELIDNNISNGLPDLLNGCENNESCVDNELSNVSEDLILTQEEVVVLVNDPNSTESNTTTENNTTSIENNGSQEDYYIVNKGVMQDEVGEEANSECDVVDFSQLEVAIDDNHIHVEMTMVELPDQVVYNRDTQDGEMEGHWTEYTWEVSFQIDDNYDISFSLSKSSGNMDGEGEKIGAILDEPSYSSLYSTNESSIDIMQYTSIENNTIIFRVPLDTHSRLQEISALTQIYFWTQHAYNGNSDDLCHDAYP